MKVQDELEQILLDEAKIEGKNEQIVRLESSAMRMTAAMDGEIVSRSRSNDQLAKYMERKEKLTKEIAKLQEQNDSRKDYLSSIIDSLKNPLFIKILYAMYFAGKSAETIGYDLGYCTRNIYYLRDKALQEAEKIIAESRSIRKFS